MMRPTALAATLGFAAAMACSSPARTHEMSTVPGSDSGVVIMVDNEHQLDVDVYRVRSGVEFRLGTVPSFGMRAFRLPSQEIISGALRLRVDPIGSNGFFTTDPILVGPDQRVELTVGAQLDQTSYSVWNRARKR